MKKIAIYGFGRIGHQLLRIGLDLNLFVPAAVADVKDLKRLTALFNVDSNYGYWKGSAKSDEEGFTLNGHEMPYLDLQQACRLGKAGC